MKRAPRAFLRDLLLRDVWRNLALFLGVVQIQILNWLLIVMDHGGLSTGWLLLFSALAMLANHRLVPLIRRAGRAGGLRRIAGRLYMNLGIATLLVGLAVLASWLVLVPLAHAALWLGLAEGPAFDVFRMLSGGLVAAVAGLFVWGISGGQWGFGRTQIRVEIEGLAPELRGLRIVQLSDLHIGNGMEGRRLERVVEAANALEPDLIAITGDLFDNDPSFVNDGASRLGALRARYGVFAVLGNHDSYVGKELVAEALAARAPGIRLLRGEWVALPVGRPLYIAGVDDPGSDWTARDLQIRSLELLAKSLPDDGPTVLLVHRPEAFHQASRLGIELMLSGHTHGGQMALPLPGGHVNPARIVTALDRGLYHRDGSTLYVNRGVGMAGPRIRFNCSREIATIELV